MAPKKKTTIDALSCVVDASGKQLSFEIFVQAGDTEPFTVSRTVAELKRFAVEIGKALKKRDITLPTLPPFDTGGSRGVDDAFLATCRTLLQMWLDESLALLKTAAEKVVFGRALEVNLSKRAEREVPKSAAARTATMAGAMAKVGMNAAATSVADTFRSKADKVGTVMTDENIEVIVDTLTKMRGAALKLAQKLNSMRQVMQVNPKLQEALDRRVLNQSMAMPRAQVEDVLASELGADWQRKIGFFNPTPFAAASIGQVHAATLDDDQNIVLKIQFPGVKESIASDLEGVVRLLGLSMKKGSRALEQNAYTFAGYKSAWMQECDYTIEAQHLATYRRHFDADTDADFLRSKFEVPTLVPSLSTERVLAQGFVSGVTLDQLCGSHVAQTIRDDVAERLVRIKFKELFVWHFMNCDPHFGNFVFNSVTKRLGLLDYGYCKALERGSMRSLAGWFLAIADDDRKAADAWLDAENIIRDEDRKAGYADQLYEYNRFLYSPFAEDAPFDFKAWYDSPTMRGFKDNVDYQNDAWGKQQLGGSGAGAGKGAEGGEGLISQQVMLITEYIMQILLHCGRLQAKIAVRRYLLDAVEAVRE